MTELHVVLGASGGIGNAIVRELVKQNKTVRGTSRSGTADVPEGVEMVAADATDYSSLERAISGASVVYNCINIPYSEWVDNYETLVETIIDVFSDTEIPLIVADNLYMYSELETKPLVESMEYNAVGSKGMVRGKIAQMYLDAHQNKKINTVLIRAPDFYGPNAIHNGYYGERIFLNAMKGKKVQIIGDPDMPHQICYIDDFARAMIVLANDPSSFGQVWHSPNDRAPTQREFVEMVFTEVNQEPKIGKINKFMLSLAGLFNKEIREVKEMYYEFVKPYLVSDVKFMNKYEFEVTPLEVGIKETIEWINQNNNN